MEWIIHRYETLDTTMREAAGRAERGEPAGTVVVAAEQTAGRGRLGRRWESERGAGLYCSLVLRPAGPAAEAPVVTLALGLAAARAIEQVSGVACDLRWPNDVLIGGRKCCGILVEMSADGDLVRHVVAGIGVNVNQTRFPEEVAETATSLRMQTGREWAVETLLEALLQEVDRHLGAMVEQGSRTIVEWFARASTYAAGRRVAVMNGATEIQGVTAGLSETGVLLLEREDGRVEPVLAGSVRPVE